MVGTVEKIAGLPNERRGWLKTAIPKETCDRSSAAERRTGREG